MSAEKKTQRNDKRRQEELKDRRSTAIYTAVAVVVVVAALALMFWNTGILQRSLTAVTIDGTKYTAAEVQYFYNSICSGYTGQYDSTVSVKDQVRDQETGQTWYDFLMDETMTAMASDTALVDRAKSEGYTLSADAQANLDATLAQLDTLWISYGATSREQFIHSSFGPYMNYDKLVSLLQMEYLASDYANTQMEAIERPESDYEAYYQENTDALDTLVFSQLAFRAYVSTVDDDGNTIELSDEEKASQLETLKAEQKALAEEVQAKLEAGEDPADLAEEYAGELYSSSISSRTTAANAVYSTYGDWLLDSSRKAGDITLSEYGSGDTTYYYYVAQFEDRFRDEEETHSVRHILVRAGDGSADPTQADYDEAEAQAQALLDEWKAGEATENSFAVLAAANSADSGSAANGGLISRITSNSSYVESFLNWSIDSARKSGDTSLVKSEYGWHVMYYVSTDDPAWKLDAASALRSEDLEQFTAEAAQGCTIAQGTGMKFVSA